MRALNVAQLHLAPGCFALERSESYYVGSLEYFQRVFYHENDSRFFTPSHCYFLYLCTAIFLVVDVMSKCI